ncbi:MAG: hypothetical protein AABW84_01925 [Nanoarchaeota archaeon]
MAEKIKLPSSEGGLVSYSGESTGAIFSIKPEYAIGFIITMVILIAVINLFY